MTSTPSSTTPLLDHGFVRLVDTMGSDLSVVRAARVSFDAEWRAGLDEKSDAKLISYLWKNKHTTPFEAATMTFEVKAPIFVFRQWHRHRTQSYNEMSARYAELPTEYYVPARDVVGTQSTKNKQGRMDADRPDFDDEVSDYCHACETSFATYRKLLDQGWPRELARAVLPVATYSRMFTTMSLLNFFRFATLRSDPHAQHEIRVYSDAMVELIRSVFPTCVAAWEAHR